MKHCLLYLPYELPEHGLGPIHIRPKKMVKAFQELGYDVLLISGSCSERKRMIQNVKQRIASGLRYEFLYTESSIKPTLLAEEKHLFPTHPLMDFHFFRYIKRHGIKIGIFYRDIVWKFDYFWADYPWWRKQLFLACYRYDIRQYEKLIDRFYLPSLKMADMIGSRKLKKLSSLLIPGAENLPVQPKDCIHRDFAQKPLHIFYAGSIHQHYCLTELLKAVTRTEHCVMTLCCREGSWLEEKAKLEPYMDDSIRVIHKHNDELEPYYQEADIGALLYENNDCMRFAMPFKSFEYLAHELPAIATEHTAIGDFIQANGNGWVIPYSAEAACELLREIIRRPELLNEMRQRCVQVKREHLWSCRAKMIEQDLSQGTDAKSG